MSEMINNGVPMNAPSNDISGYTYDTPPTYASLQDQINELDENLTQFLVHSTEEKDTGKIWVDGKKIFSKSYVLTNPSHNTTIDNVINSNYIDTLISEDGSFKDSNDNSNSPFPFLLTQSIYTYVQIFPGGTKFYVQGLTTSKVSFTLEYTKK